MAKTTKAGMEMAKPVRIEVILEDGTHIIGEDFVAIINNPECDARMFYSADAVTLGQAIQMLSFAYTDQLSKMPAEQANEVREALRAFIEMESD